MIKLLSYMFFALNYKLGTILPTKKNFVFSIMTHDSSETGNIKALTSYMVPYGYEFFYIERDIRRRFFYLLFVIPFIMARAEIILMDNAFMPMSFFKIRKGTKVLQLWHGTGSIKKFGQDSNVGLLKTLEKRINRNINYLFVNSDILIDEYAHAFGIEKSKVFVTGLPRTDWLFKLMNNPDKILKISKIKRKVENSLNISLENKHILLYAPTFRDNEVKKPKLHLNVEILSELLPDNTIIFLKLHPFVMSAFNKDNFNKKIINVSTYNDLNELMTVADALITDYSSLIFDFCIFKRPIYFFADDFENFSQERGFYLDRAELPGLFTDSEIELADEIKNVIENKETEKYLVKRKEFFSKYYRWTDGNSSKRVYETVLR